MKQAMRSLALVLILGLSMFGFQGCGGGGGGGGGSVDSEDHDTYYTGLTSQAAVTSDNARPLVAEALMGGITGSPTGVYASLANITGPGTDFPLATLLSELMEETLLQTGDLLLLAPRGSGIARDLMDPYTLDGECGGSAILTPSEADENTGKVAGKIVYKSFCYREVIFSGTARFSGTINMTTGAMSLTYTFSDLRVLAGSASSTVNGPVKVVRSADGLLTMTYNTYNTDNKSQKTAWLRDYVMQMEKDGSYTGMAINGRYYDPEYGYVDLETMEIFIFASGDSYPYTGALSATGENGTQALLYIYDSETYMVEADTNGDGVYDWTSGTLRWIDWYTGGGAQEMLGEYDVTFTIGTGPCATKSFSLTIGETLAATTEFGGESTACYLYVPLSGIATTYDYTEDGDTTTRTITAKDNMITFDEVWDDEPGEKYTGHFVLTFAANFNSFVINGSVEEEASNACDGTVAGTGSRTID